MILEYKYQIGDIVKLTGRVNSEYRGTQTWCLRKGDFIIIEVHSTWYRGESIIDSKYKLGFLENEIEYSISTIRDNKLNDLGI